MGNLYVVVGATGHVGSIVAKGLLDAGKKVRVISRDAQKLEPFTDRKAEAAVGSVKDRSFAVDAFAGGTAAFVMVPPDMSIATGFRRFQKQVAENLANAVQIAGIKHVVTLSSVGGHLDRGNGPVAGLHDMEEIFNKLGNTHVLHLRPGMFMENLLGNLDMIKQMGVLGTPAKPDLPLTLIATKDIGKIALQHLLDLDFTGYTVQELLGPRNITMKDVTKVIGSAIGKPDLPYVQFSYEDAANGLVEMGIPKERADMYVELYRGFNDGRIKPTQQRMPETQTPTTFEQFAGEVIAPAFRAS